MAEWAGMKPIALFTVGALTFGAAQAVWSVGHHHALWKGSWMLKTGTGIAACFVVFVIVSAIVCALRGRNRSLGDCIVSITFGAVVAMAISLFIVGAGSLWPLVLALDGVILTAAVALGAALSGLVRPLLHRGQTT